MVINRRINGTIISEKAEGITLSKISTKCLDKNRIDVMSVQENTIIRDFIIQLQGYFQTLCEQFEPL